jgi:uncharacterized linocin/CFP29 family protein
MEYLNRKAATFDPALWEEIDTAATAAARELLTGRRFLEIEGPFGVGLTSVEVGEDGYCREPGPDEAGAVVSRAISVPMLKKNFGISIRRLEATRSMGQPLNLTAVQDAAEAVARREEEFIYYGNRDFGLDGLLTSAGRNRHDGGDWKDTQQALDDVLAAVNLLDGKGFGGPYALALSPPLYNGLFRRYEGTDMLQLEHLRRLCDAGVYKAHIEGAVLVDPRLGKLVIGQDLMAGYAGQDGIHHELYLCESLVLMLEEPGAVCTIEMGGKGNG